MAKTGFTATREKIRGLPPAKKELALKLYNKAMFMENELEKLQKILKEKGWSEAYQNGANQFGLKKSTEGDVYNTMIKSYSSIIKQLNDMLKEDDPAPEDELLQFLSGGDAR